VNQCNAHAQKMLYNYEKPGSLYNGMVMQQDEESVDSLDEVRGNQDALAASGSRVLAGWALVA